VERKTPWGKMRRHAFTTAVVTIVLILAEMACEAHGGEEIKQLTYVGLQRRLTNTFRTVDLPVVVLDISDVAGEPIAQRERLATPRATLREFVDTLASLHDKPRAIGIDVDFSQDDGQWVTAEDPAFFQHCLDVSKEVPVYLGVGRGIPLGPDGWLGKPEYKELAAAILIPNEGRTMFQVINTGRGELESMSYKLVRHLGRPMPPPWLPAWSLEQFRERSYKKIKFGSFLIDYSAVDTLEHESVNVTKPDTIKDAAERFTDKVVLVGKATRGKTMDMFAVAGRSGNQPVAGVVVHASAVYSAYYPLFEFRWWAELLLDILLVAMGQLVLLAAMKIYSGGGEAVAVHRLEVVYSLLAALFVFSLGLAVRTTRVMWDGFLIVALVMVLHPFVPRMAAPIGSALKNTFREVRPSSKPQEDSKDAHPSGPGTAGSADDIGLGSS